MNRGTPLLTYLCLAMRSDYLGIFRGLGEVMTCIYGSTVTFAFPDPLIAAYRHSVTHISLVSLLNGTALNWCEQEYLRGQMSDTVLLGKIKDPELIELNFTEVSCNAGWGASDRDQSRVIRVPREKGQSVPEDPGLNRNVRGGEKRTDCDTGSRCLTRFPSGVSDNQEKDLGDDESSNVLANVYPSYRSSGAAAESVHPTMGSAVYWILVDNLCPLE